MRPVRHPGYFFLALTMVVMLNGCTELLQLLKQADIKKPVVELGDADDTVAARRTQSTELRDVLAGREQRVTDAEAERLRECGTDDCVRAVVGSEVAPVDDAP